MKQTSKKLQAIPQTTLRRLRNTPSYFFLLWRWSAWLYAFVTLISIHGWPYGAHDVPSPDGPLFALLANALLAVTFVQSLVVTLYAPVFQIFIPGLPGMKKLRQPGQHIQTQGRNRRRNQHSLAVDEEADILTPLARTRNPYWDVVIYGADLLICSLVVYLGGYFGSPHFGSSSPFYRYGISTALAAALTYRYRGGLLVAFGYDLFIIVGAFHQPPGLPPGSYTPLNARDLVGSLIDTPLIAILAAYFSTLLASYTRSKRREQHNVRSQKALRQVSETLVAGGSDRERLLRTSVEQIRKGGHFARLVVALLERDQAEDGQQKMYVKLDSSLEGGALEAPVEDNSAAIFAHVMRTGQKFRAFEPLAGEEEYGIARLYLPIVREEQLYIILGAESMRETPFDNQQEEFLRTTGAQLVVALENIRLTEQTVELAALAERGRIAREIHDGIAQLVYMLSLNTETCAALVHRLAEAAGKEGAEGGKEALAPLAERLDKVVTISKQALWETRHYMFTLKPLISGTTTLTQMLTSQLHEFEAISGLVVQLEVEGDAQDVQGEVDRHQARKLAQVGTAVFRITQEALTNAYKHAEASRLGVHLRYLPERIEVEIRDNGKGLSAHLSESGANGELLRLYSGHGMGGMRARAEELGGSFEVRQLDKGGLCVSASLPVQARDRDYVKNTPHDRR